MSGEHLPVSSGFGTRAVHCGQEPEKWTYWEAVPPISLSTTYKQQAPGEHKGFEYSRSGNPTRQCLEEAFQGICNGKHALTWGSGLGGTQAILQLLKAGDHIVAIDDLYGGTNRMIRRIGAPMGLTFDFVNASDPDTFAKAFTPKTRLVWIETPTNPLLQIADIRAIAKRVKAHGNCILVVDNTFMSAYFQRPLELGADIEFASVTKYYNGHSDVVMGMTATNSDEIAEKLRFLQYAGGAVPSPFDCFLVNRGLKTLHLRMEAHSRNAMRVATYLSQHPKVRSVLYPGLPSHPNHKIAVSQCSGFSGMISFRIRGDLEAAKKFLTSAKIFTLAESLGAVESLAEHPAIMTHASVPAEQRRQLGIEDDLIRLSCGVEDTIDLLRDIEQALDAAVPSKEPTPNVLDFLHIEPTHRRGKAPAAAAPAAAAPAAAAPASPARVAGKKTAGLSGNNDAPFATEVVVPAAAKPAAAPAAAPAQQESAGRPSTARVPPGGRSSILFG